MTVAFTVVGCTVVFIVVVFVVTFVVNFVVVFIVVDVVVGGVYAKLCNTERNRFMQHLQSLRICELYIANFIFCRARS